MSISIPQRLSQLRAVIQTQGYDYCLIPSADPHLSEYLPERWQAREVFSGFTGSVATLIVGQDFAGLWVDSRYWEQADIELRGSGIEMIKIVGSAATAHIDWLAQQMQANQRLAVDGKVLGLASARALQNALYPKRVQIDTNIDLVDQVWSDRPGLPTAAVYEHQAPFAVVSRSEKLATVRKAMKDKGCSHHFISTVDDIAWLLNLRGADVNYNPVFVSHLLLSADQAELFLPLQKIDADLRDRLARDGVICRDYDEAESALQNLSASSSILIDPRRITFGFREAIPQHCKVIEALNPSVFAKSRKTPEEAQFVRQAMEQDGAALCEFFAWFESAIQDPTNNISELTIDEKICAARARQAHFICPSFGTIAGFNGNGAMPHYRATEKSYAQIKGNGLLLIDSGGQYLNGTTDITRVVSVGTVSAEQKRDFTLVLKGMIALSRMKFPHGTYSTVLDAIARAPIWAEGINYGHGTGHGVGYFLNVHEGPQTISGAIPDANMVMEVGMITSNEPGIYRPGKWGIRIENLLLCVPAESTEFGDYLQFETLTLCPIDTRCIDRSMMREDEIAWLNHYHQMVFQRLSPRASGAALAWITQRTLAI
ncbi:aminopeptidase P family protein [Undibacterium cyanobacteriorum]|uniref:Aminopeptidase P family protein n=1 Tax=Undibacterium cyanobacteriorum TaxID=3073561 RepID=A0ABY9RK62_9BURK|nr:aminopeptidase P family protein [Undibacterium sp. 20NA77.5]WMW81622.1 aminopeptidase P family protein [Undibacterium sp. 20NA77.5]